MDKKYSKVNVVIGEKQELTKEQQNCDVLCVTMFKDKKDKKIADLEAKLAESEKELEKNDDEWREICDGKLETINRLIKEKHELQQQLAEKEKEIERVKQEKTCYYNFGANCHKVTFKTIDGKEFDVYNDKGYQAIKELEELKNYLPNIALDIPDMVSYMKLLNKIDRQISNLKGDK